MGLRSGHGVFNTLCYLWCHRVTPPAVMVTRVPSSVCSTQCWWRNSWTSSVEYNVTHPGDSVVIDEINVLVGVRIKTWMMNVWLFWQPVTWLLSTKFIY